MIQPMYDIMPHDSVNSPFVLRRIDSTGKLVFMDEYADLVCKSCRKVDERAALTRGISSAVTVKSKRPYLFSSDNFCIANARCKDVLAGILPGDLDFFPIPSSEFYVAVAKEWIPPSETNPGIRIVGRRCRDCGRPREALWSKSPPVVDKVKPLLAFNLETTWGALVIWLASKDVADKLKGVSPPLTGMEIVPKDVEVREQPEPAATSLTE